MKWILYYFTLLFPIFLYAQEPLPTPVGKVVWVNGIFKAFMMNKEERSLQKNSIIYLKDKLQTAKDSTAEIIFTDNTLMSFRSESIFNVNEYTFTKKAKSSTGKYLMELVTGGFRTITGLIAKDQPKNYQIKTPVATIGVRGTDFAAYIKNGELFVGAYSGSPCVQNEKENLCLSKEVPYARVPSAQSSIIPLKETPDALGIKPEITLTTMEGFAPLAPSQRPTGRPNLDGPIGSFCITQ